MTRKHNKKQQSSQNNNENQEPNFESMGSSETTSTTTSTTTAPTTSSLTNDNDFPALADTMTQREPLQETNEGVQLRVVDKVRQLPLAHKVSSLYENYARNSSYRLVQNLVHTAERGTQSLIAHSKPILCKHQDKVNYVDNMACAGFDKIDESVHRMQSVKENLSRRVSETQINVKNQAQSTQVNVRNQLHAKRDAVLNQIKTASETLQQRAPVLWEVGAKANTVATGVEQKFTSAAESAMHFAERKFEHVLPHDDSDEAEVDATTITTPTPTPSEEADTPIVGQQTVRVVGEAVRLTDRVRRRLFSRAMKQMGEVKLRSEEAVQRCRQNTVSLLEYAQNHFNEHMEDSEGDDEDITAISSESPSLSLTRKATRATLRTGRCIKAAVQASAAIAMDSLNRSSDFASESFHFGQGMFADIKHFVSVQTQRGVAFGFNTTAAARDNVLQRVTEAKDQAKDKGLKLYEKAIETRLGAQLKAKTLQAVEVSKPYVFKADSLLESTSPFLHSQTHSLLNYVNGYFGLNIFGAQQQEDNSLASHMTVNEL